MKKQVAGTIIQNSEQGTSFLVGQTADGSYYFYQLEVRSPASPLASVLWELRHTVGIDVDQLRLYDSIIAEVDDQKVSVFVFDHLSLDQATLKQFERVGLKLVPASQLHRLFESVKVTTLPSLD